MLSVKNIIDIDDERKFDLSRIFIDIYGKGYTAHPRLESLLKLNNIKPLDFKTGAEEAAAFDQKNYVGLHQSTLRKVDIIANIAQLADHNQLRTLTKWWQMCGGNLKGYWDWAANHPGIVLLLTLIGIAISVWQVRFN